MLSFFVVVLMFFVVVLLFIEIVFILEVLFWVTPVEVITAESKPIVVRSWQLMRCLLLQTHCCKQADSWLMSSCLKTTCCLMQATTAATAGTRGGRRLRMMWKTSLRYCLPAVVLSGCSSGSRILALCSEVCVSLLHRPAM